MDEKPTTDLRLALRSLYASQLRSPAVWNDSSDAAFIATHLIERSIAALAPRLSGFAGNWLGHRIYDIFLGRTLSRPFEKLLQHMQAKAQPDAITQRRAQT
jgi:hypothetical protein